ncbi:MAG: hypothetical protein IKT16_06625 [Desulfovibrio sp.]|nr:hypothetical protein [Desulfovibrio sp.]MBR4747686.1 hypothetical protein [Desulfovibrio sp.]MBR5050540.1 hypothetical protein [Desulfovibrio sp.]MBR6467811.1 hypothetical protein [Desulfovibrio sp.]
MPSFLANVHASMYRDGAPQELTPEQEASKREMYEKLKPRGRRYVDRIGYENWDPFMKPNDPLDIRQDVTKRTTQELIREFLQTVARTSGESYSNEYAQGALQAALGIVNRDVTMIGTMDFCLWYVDLLKREGHLEVTLNQLHAAKDNRQDQ